MPQRRNNNQGMLDFALSLPENATDPQIRAALLARNPGISRETLKVQMSECRWLVRPPVRRAWNSIAFAPSVRGATPERRHYAAFLCEIRRRFKEVTAP